jgi:hypothetical protein
MKPQQILATTLTLCALTSLGAGAEPTPKQQTCEVSKGIQRNGVLQAEMPPGGSFVFRPGGPGFIDRDGALGIKFYWVRPAGSALIVGGRRLDAEAPPARAYMNDGYLNADGQPTYLVFPTPGCWQITGRVGDRSLTFIVQVEKEGNGPDWKFEGLPPGGFWYQTTLESGRTAG